jgi:heat shock protein HtpX
MALKTAGLQTSIWNNNIKSVLLLAFYPFLLIGLLWAIGAAIGAFMGSGTVNGALTFHSAVNFGNAIAAQYWHIVLAVVAVWFVVAYFFNTKMVRSLSHSHPVTRADEPELYNLLENLCISRGMTMPKLEIIETGALNAFASGVDDRSFSITITRGLLQTLQKDEIEAVLGHELSHIRHRDVRLLIISVIFTGMIGFAAQMIWSMVRHNLFSVTRVHRRNRREGGGGQIIILLMVVGAILWIGYMATLFTRFALSRRREFMADAGSVDLTHNPEAMMRALMKIAGKDKLSDTPDDIALMCIENSHPFFGIFATHPPIEKRIRVLSENTGISVPDMSGSSGTATRRNPWDV